MIIVRDVFQIDPAQMKQATDAAKGMRDINKRLGHPVARILTDLVGQYYTLVFESEFPDLAAYQKAIDSVLKDAEWQAAYRPMRVAIRSGHREIYKAIS